MSQRLIGDWTLVSYDAIAPDGSRSQPFGDARGRLRYDAYGNMAGQVMRPDRPRVELGTGSALRVRDAYTGYIAYFGTYAVNAAGDTVIHHVQAALNPAWVGGDQVRQMRFEGDLLVLQADVEKNQQTMRHVLTWRKLG